MVDFEIKDHYDLDDYVKLIKALRDPVNGCPWDREQTHESIRENFLEEVCEAMEAIDRNDKELLLEELGDVMMQVLLHAEIEHQSGGFDIYDIADASCKKLVFRHPHIFGDVVAETSDKVLSTWEDVKRVEKKQKTGWDAMNDVARTFPALMRSQKVQKRAAYVGFDYPDVSMAMDDLRSEVDELQSALDGSGDLEEEIGDVIFSAVNVARFAGVESELAAERACEKFMERFHRVEKLAAEQGVNMSECGIDRLNELWYTAKSSPKD